MHDFLNDWITRSRWTASTADIVAILEKAADTLRREFNEAGGPTGAVVATLGVGSPAFLHRPGAAVGSYKES